MATAVSFLGKSAPGGGASASTGNQPIQQGQSQAYKMGQFMSNPMDYLKNTFNGTNFSQGLADFRSGWGAGRAGSSSPGMAGPANPSGNQGMGIANGAGGGADGLSSNGPMNSPDPEASMGEGDAVSGDAAADMGAAADTGAAGDAAAGMAGDAGAGMASGAAAASM